MKAVAAFCLAAVPFGLLGQTPVSLPEVTVYSPRVANQSPAGTFSMPISALRYEPRVDIQSRNLAEGQADVTLRGGTFENTAFQLGAVTLLDSQTGHYLAEFPVAPALLGAPELRVGADLATSAINANVGAVSYGWRPIRTAGAASVAMGEYGLRRGELYQGLATKPASKGATRWGADVAVARSEANGSVPYGEHEFERLNA